MECKILKIVNTPKELEDHRKYMRKRFMFDLPDGVKAHIANFFNLNRLYKAIKDGMVVIFLIGSVSGLRGTGLEDRKGEVISFSEELLEQAGFFVVSAEDIGYGPGKGKGDPQYWTYMACRYLLLFCNLLASICVGAPSTGAGEEMGFGDGEDIPCVGLEFYFQEMKNPNHFSNSSSTIGNPRRIFFQIDPTDQNHFQTLLTFYTILNAAMKDKTIGICDCEYHGRTFYIQPKVDVANMCLQEFARQMCGSLYKDAFKSRSTV